MTKVSRTSQRKADANRRNASKSTGPKTPHGKARSRLNALKHGILASQAVIATIEGPAERKMFEAVVEGLAQDFQPVGTYEQLLVQEIAACFWRKRRLLMFENHAAFSSLDHAATQVVNDPDQHAVWNPALYLLDDKLVSAEQVYADAGLEHITLPNEADTNRVIRYEAAINRTRERAVASLREMKKSRGASALRTPATPVIDHAAARRNASRMQPTMMSPFLAMQLWHNIAKVTEEAEDANQEARENVLRAAEEELKGSNRETDRTKPNTLSDAEQTRRIRATMNEIFGTNLPLEAPSGDPDKPPAA